MLIGSVFPDLKTYAPIEARQEAGIAFNCGASCIAKITKVALDKF